MKTCGGNCANDECKANRVSKKGKKCLVSSSACTSEPHNFSHFGAPCTLVALFVGNPIAPVQGNTCSLSNTAGLAIFGDDGRAHVKSAFWRSNDGSGIKPRDMTPQRASCAITNSSLIEYWPWRVWHVRFRPKIEMQHSMRYYSVDQNLMNTVVHLNSCDFNTSIC